MKPQKFFLQQAGVYGFDHLEPVILASLVTEDPLLLIGKAGTGKTYLLNSLSEALGLDHRHYNASYLSFDDLIGFPYPAADGKSITFIPTPATIWNAESILVDELSRCKPEVQNKFFSIVHEKKIQGIYLDKLRYRWAAMNPIPSAVTEEEDQYEGSITLDQALADRFAFIIDVPDWDEMTEAEQVKIIHPAGEGAISNLSVDLSEFISRLRKEFTEAIRFPSHEVVTYCRAITTLMTDAGYRISPRRARLMARNFTALFLVMKELGAGDSEKERSRIFKLGFKWSLPHRAYKKMKFAGHVIDTAHQQAVIITYKSKKEDRWLHEFHMAPLVSQKIEMLINGKVTVDQKSIAFIRFLNQAGLKDKAILAFTAYPFFKARGILNEEAMNELSAIAAKVFYVNGTLEWSDHNSVNNTMHPQWSDCTQFLAKMPGSKNKRKKRATQLLLYLVLNKQDVQFPEKIEEELNNCFIKIQTYAGETIKQ